jgi:heme exporter protein C
MLAGMLVMTVGLWAYAIAAALTRLRCIILERESHSEWVARLAEFQS